MVRGQWVNLARMLWLHLLFFEGHPGIFNDHRELGPRLNTPSKDGAFYSIVSPSLHWGFRTHTDPRVSTPCWSH